MYNCICLYFVIVFVLLSLYVIIFKLLLYFYENINICIVKMLH